MPPAWHPEALRAQAVAARSYATWDRDHPGPWWYDTCDSTACQVFRGVATYNAAGELVTFAGAVAFTQFSASNGCWTVAGTAPYLRAFADPYDGLVASTAHSWTENVDASVLESAYPFLGRVRSLQVMGRDGNGEWGARVASVILRGSTGSISLIGADFRTVTGLRSTWWVPTNTSRVDVHSFEGDVANDLLARQSVDGSLWLYPGNGAEAFGGPRQIGAGWQQMDAIVAAGDLDTDGHPDLAARRAFDGALLLYLGTGASGFQTARQVGKGWQAMHPIMGGETRTGMADTISSPNGRQTARCGCTRVEGTVDSEPHVGSAPVGPPWMSWSDRMTGTATSGPT